MHKVQNEIQRKDLNKVLVKLQKPVILFMFAVMILMFVYSFVFMTPFYNLMLIDGNLPKRAFDTYGIVADNYPKEYFNKAGGLNLSYFIVIFRPLVDGDKPAMQVFNHWIFNWSFFGILVACLLFVFFSQKRKRYQASNFIVCLITIAFEFYVGFTLLSKLSYHQGLVEQLDYDVINAFTAYRTTTGTPAVYEFENFSWIFTVGKVVALVVVLAAIVGSALLVAKALYQIKNKPIDISEVNINE